MQGLDRSDFRCFSLLFCYSFGMGSVTFSGVFAASGPTLASLMLYMEAMLSLYLSIVVSECLLNAPPYVRTYGDLSAYIAGPVAQWIANGSQALICLTVPVAFLVFGGTTLLPHLFGFLLPQAGPNEWICLFALGILPTCYLSNRKESNLVVWLGAFGAILADAIAVGVVLAQRDAVPRVTEVTFSNTLQSYGKISFAFGVATMVPVVQRQHSDPPRMPRIIAWVVACITFLYGIIGITSYVRFGCAAPNDLLKELPTNDEWKYIAYMGMFIHIAVAFPLVLNPILYIIERRLFGFEADWETQQQYLKSHSIEVGSNILLIDDNENSKILTKAVHEIDQRPYGTEEGAKTQEYLHRLLSAESWAEKETRSTWTNRMYMLALRTSIVIVQTFLAALLQASFTDILGFLGSGAVSVSAILLPMYLYTKVLQSPKHQNLPFSRTLRRLCYVGLLFISFLSICNIVKSVANIVNKLPTYQFFGPAVSMEPLANVEHFPFCEIGEREL